jgi:aryl-phospho-beta-D-glucosidase BglC (GH1 family)
MMTRFLMSACLTAAMLGTFGLSAADNFDVKRCMNMGNALDAPKEGEWGHVIQADSFRVIKQAGFDTVRIPIRWSAHTGGGPNYKINDRFFRRVDEVINQALSQDLQVIINVHHFEELNEDPQGNFAKFIALWSQIAPRYASLPDSVYFEVLNEPNGKLGGDIMRQVLKAGFNKIRETNPTRILILGGENWSGINTLPSIPAIDDPNQVYTFHYYDPFEFTHQKTSWTHLENSGSRGWGSRDDRRQLKAAADYAKKTQDDLGIPLFMGEIGAYQKAPYDDVVRYTEETRKAFEGAGISWCVWSFTETFPFYDQNTRRWDEQKLAALGLGYGASSVPLSNKASKKPTISFKGQSLDQVFTDIQKRVGRNAVIMMSPYVDELGSYGPAKISIKSDKAVPEGQVLDIKTAKGQNPWDSALSGAFIPPVKRGDTILMTYWAKAVSGPGNIASVGIQLAQEPYSALSTNSETLSSQWEQYYISAKADRDYAPEELGFTLQVAGAAQTLRVGPILVMNFGQNVPASRLPQ